LKVDTWNILKNYAKKSLLFIDDEIQLRSIIISNSNQNEFVYSMQMSLFHRLKLLKHSAMLLTIQYRMINVIENMIFILFYDQRLQNEHETDIKSRFISQTIVQYAHDKWFIRSSLIFIDVLEHTNKDNTSSFFNLINAFVIMKLTIDFIKKKIMKSIELVILIFYQIQMKVYRQVIKNLFLIEFLMINIQIKTINFMQRNQASVIIMNVIMCKKINFLRLRNRVNMTCFRVMNELFIVDDVTSIMKEKIFRHRHIDNVFTFIIEKSTLVKANHERLSSWISTSFVSRDLKDQTFDKEIDQSITSTEEWKKNAVHETKSEIVSSAWNDLNVQTFVEENNQWITFIEEWKEHAEHETKATIISSSWDVW
jgi:hypothetical protein